MRMQHVLLLALASATSSLPSFGAVRATTLSASSFGGADASVKINSCIEAVIAGGGGTCDASDFTGTQVMSKEIDVGSPSSVAAKISVVLILPEAATWVWKVNNSASCGIMQYSSTSVVSNQPGGGGNRMVLSAQPPSSMDSLYCTAPSQSGSYVHARGFAMVNEASGNSFASGVVHIRNIVDQSSFERLFGSNYYGDVWHIDSACCGTVFESIQGTSSGTLGYPGVGGIPLLLGPGKVDGVAFRDSNFNAPGVSFPDILTTGESAVNNVNFYNIYMEGNGAVDSTTPMIKIGAYAGPIHFFGGLINTEQTSNASTKYVFQNSGFLLDVQGMGVANTKLGINDLTMKVKVPVWDYSGNLGMIPSYSSLQGMYQ